MEEPKKSNVHCIVQAVWHGSDQTQVAWTGSMGSETPTLLHVLLLLRLWVDSIAQLDEALAELPVRNLDKIWFDADLTAQHLRHQFLHHRLVLSQDPALYIQHYQ